MHNALTLGKQVNIREYLESSIEVRALHQCESLVHPPGAAVFDGENVQIGPTKRRRFGDESHKGRGESTSTTRLATSNVVDDQPRTRRVWMVPLIQYGAKDAMDAVAEGSVELTSAA